MKSFKHVFVAVFLSVILHSALSAQPEVMAWGNITGIRVEGQLMEFESSVRVVEKGWLHYTSTGKERQQPKYDRDGLKQNITTSMKEFRFVEVVEDTGKELATVSVKTTAVADTVVEGVFFCIELPDKYYSGANAQFIKGSSARKSKTSLSEITPDNNPKPFKIAASGVVVTSQQRQLEINSDAGTTVFLRKETGNSGVTIYFNLMGPEIKNGQGQQNSLTCR